MRNGWIALAFVAGALLGAVGGAALLNATRGQATLLSYELAPDGQQEIRVLVGVGRLDSFNFVDVQEDVNAVRISVDVLHWRGTAPADMKLLYVPVRLDQPLGTRSVLDGAGQPVPLRRPALQRKQHRRLRHRQLRRPRLGRAARRGPAKARQCPMSLRGSAPPVSTSRLSRHRVIPRSSARTVSINSWSKARWWPSTPSRRQRRARWCSMPSRAVAQLSCISARHTTSRSQICSWSSPRTIRRSPLRPSMRSRARRK